MQTVNRSTIGVLPLLFFAVAGLGSPVVMAQTPPPVPSGSGFYYSAGAKYRRLPDCRGDECKACVTSAWIEAASVTPVAGDTPSFLLKALLVPPTPREQTSSAATRPGLLAVVDVVTLRIDSGKLVEVASSLKVLESTEDTVSLSFDKPLEPGTYAVFQWFPAAARYASLKSVAGSLCFLVFDDKSNIIGPPTPLGVFVVR